jgi:hypothetical protein
MQIKEQIGQVESYVNNPEAAPKQNPQAPTNTSDNTPLSQEEIAKILEGAYLE